jgi:hypothetical protein
MSGAALWAQQQPVQTPEHPIDTRPEGQGKSCSYTITSSSGEKITGSSNCAAPADTPTTQKFPYPGEAGAMDAPTQPTQTPQGDSTAKRLPYPGEEGAGDAPSAGTKPAPPEAGGLKDAGSSGESSSSSSALTPGESSSSSASAPSPDDVNSDTPPAPKRNTHTKPEPPPKDIAAQEAEDLQVAGFYMNDKNWRGAYGRAQDAVRLAGDDADAHLALAESARRLGKLDEAEKEYRRVLTLDPVPKTRKTAERALNEMTGGS